jgi:hypothetical protein
MSQMIEMPEREVRIANQYFGKMMAKDEEGKPKPKVRKSEGTMK